MRQRGQPVNHAQRTVASPLRPHAHNIYIYIYIYIACTQRIACKRTLLVTASEVKTLGQSRGYNALKFGRWSWAFFAGGSAGFPSYT